MTPQGLKGFILFTTEVPKAPVLQEGVAGNNCTEIMTFIFYLS
jgi:hypothetical protein